MKLPIVRVINLAKIAMKLQVQILVQWVLDGSMKCISSFMGANF